MNLEFSALGPDPKKDPTPSGNFVLHGEIIPVGDSQESVNKKFKVTSSLNPIGEQLYYKSINKGYKLYISQQGRPLSELEVTK